MIKRLQGHKVGTVQASAHLQTFIMLRRHTFFQVQKSMQKWPLRPAAGGNPIYNKKRPPGKLTPQSLRSDSSGLKSFLIVNAPAEGAKDIRKSIDCLHRLNVFELPAERAWLNIQILRVFVAMRRFVTTNGIRMSLLPF